MGRSRFNRLVLDEDRISAHHAEIRTLPSDGGFVIIDRSSNGTRVNNLKLKPHQETPLNGNEKIEFGNSPEFKFRKNSGVKPEPIPYGDTITDKDDEDQIDQDTFELRSMEIITLDDNYQIVTMTESARRILNTFFPANSLSDRRLPEDVYEHLHSEEDEEDGYFYPKGNDDHRISFRLESPVVGNGRLFRIIEEDRLSFSRLKQGIRADGKTLGKDITAKEGEFLYYAATGLGNRSIATIQGVSIETVKSHAKNAYQKLGTDRTQIKEILRDILQRS